MLPKGVILHLLEPIWCNSFSWKIDSCSALVDHFLRWFMPVNIGFTFLIGGILGWILVKILRPKPYLEGLVIATCSSG
jgi:hypothetical protein